MSHKFDVTNELDVYEIDGSDTRKVGGPKMQVKNHWNRKAFVMLEFEGKSLTVLADDLKRAIDNSQNAHSF